MGDAGVSDQTLADAAVGRRPAGGAETVKSGGQPPPVGDCLIPGNMTHSISRGECGEEAAGGMSRRFDAAQGALHILGAGCAAGARLPFYSRRTGVVERNVAREIKWILRWCGSSPR